VEGDDPAAMHQAMAATLDEVVDEIAAHPGDARGGGRAAALADDRAAHAQGLDRAAGGRRRRGGTFRSHQVPLAQLAERPSTLEAARGVAALATGPRSCSTSDGAARAELAELAPTGERRMGANPHANGGELLRDLRMPDFRDYASTCPRRARRRAEATRVLGGWLRDVVQANPETFRIFGPDETASNRLGAVFEVTDRQWLAEIRPTDDHLALRGRVLEVLSEHLCQGWLRATSSPAATGSSTATRRSSTSWTRCSTSTPSG
jgi:xylulose-5-phosphate/fructose-6-phosphate phosphoketolase